MLIGNGISPMKPIISGGNGYSYLVDDYSTGLAQACAVNLLSSTYVGSCIRIRRASDNGEVDIGFNGNWLDEADIATHCGVSEGFIVKVYDQSGNGYDMTQTSHSLQYQIWDGSAVNKTGGLPGMYSSGGDERMLMDANCKAVDTWIFMVTDTTNDAVYIMYADGSAGSRYVFAAQNGSGSGASSFSGTPKLFVDGSEVTTLTRDTVHDNQIGRHQITYGDCNFVTQWGANDLYLTGYNSWGMIGYHQAVIVYTADKSSDRADIEGIINNYYGT